MRTLRLTAPAARRVALAAQGLAVPRPAGAPDRRHLRRVLGHIGLLQIDSVAAVVRSHYLPAFSRLGPYPRDLVDRAAYRDRELFEYWGHEASLLPVDLQPLLRWRMAHYRDRVPRPGSHHAIATDRPGYVADVLAEVRARGPLAAADLPRERTGRGTWWDWDAGKSALEYLFAVGDVAVATRRGFERRYDVTERVLPAAVLAAPTPTVEAAHRALLLRAAAHHGVATVTDLADYHRLPKPSARLRIDELVAAGELVAVEVEGWRAPAYARPGLVVPRRVSGRALLSPFDPVVWERSRAARLFGFDFRIEIYVPEAKRKHGYYVLPFLLGDRLVARVDLRSDRKAGVLRVPAAHAEDGVDLGEVAAELAAELVLMAGWLGLPGGVEVAGAGDLGPALAAAVRHGAGA